MKLIIKVALMLSLISMAACSFPTVPPTAKGKILTTAGYDTDIKEPGKYTLWGRDTMILIQTNTNTYKEVVNVVLQDKLTLQAEVRFRGRLAGSKTVLNSMFNDIVPGEDNMVSFNEVYKIYGRMAVRNKAREILSQYSVEDVHKNYSRLSGEIGKALIKALEGTPLEISDVALGNIAYPKVVTDAVEQAKKRELDIKKEQAQAAIDMVKKKNERILAEADYQIEITKAKAIRDANKIIGQGVTPELLKLRALDVQRAMAKNGSAVFIPYEAMNSIGAQVRMYGK
ncbi:MAG: hypothetical protein JKY81_02470 [Colwellia sp.]|nr:hypothetical protein [Colwellia sp.]